MDPSPDWWNKTHCKINSQPETARLQPKYSDIQTIDFHGRFGDSAWNQSLETVSDVRRGWSSISCVPEPAKTEVLYSRYECWRVRVKEDATEEVNLTTELFEECGMDEAVT